MRPQRGGISGLDRVALPLINYYSEEISGGGLHLFSDRDRAIRIFFSPVPGPAQDLESSPDRTPALALDSV